MYTHVQLATLSSAELGPSRDYSIDLAPKVRIRHVILGLALPAEWLYQCLHDSQFVKHLLGAS